jgi:hypothetical protein
VYSVSKRFVAWRERCRAALVTLVVQAFDNRNGLTVTAGLALLYAGAAHFSVGAANLLLGGFLVILGLVPYFWRR